MKRASLLLLVSIFIGCGKNKVVELPQINTTTISEVLDVSPAYIFYDTATPDSVEFNRKNLISTTNWLVNVDKRLSMKQVLPHLQYLQNKRRKKGMHSNAAAKNYFTCNNISQKTLGFMDFTDVTYTLVDDNNSETNSIVLLEDSPEVYNDIVTEHTFITVSLIIDKNKKVLYNNQLLSLSDYINMIPVAKYPIVANGFALDLYFMDSMSFQDYISIKSELSQQERTDIIINPVEYFYEYKLLN